MEIVDRSLFKGYEDNKKNQIVVLIEDTCFPDKTYLPVMPKTKMQAEEFFSSLMKFCLSKSFTIDKWGTIEQMTTKFMRMKDEKIRTQNDVDEAEEKFLIRLIDNLKKLGIDLSQVEKSNDEDAARALAVKIYSIINDSKA